MDFTVNMSARYRAGLVWFRRDLRTTDHAALYHALRQCARVYCVFVFDRTILDALPRTDLRVDFIRSAVEDLDTDLRTLCGHPEGGLMVLVAGVAVAQKPGGQSVLRTQFNRPDEVNLGISKILLLHESDGKVAMRVAEIGELFNRRGEMFQGVVDSPRLELQRGEGEAHCGTAVQNG